MILAILIRVLFFFLIIVAVGWIVIEIVLRYILPIFSTGLRAENHIYKKWKKTWKGIRRKIK